MCCNRVLPDRDRSCCCDSVSPIRDRGCSCRECNDVGCIRESDCFTVREGNLFCICVRNPRSWR